MTGPRPGNNTQSLVYATTQYMASGIAVKTTHNYPNETVDVAFNPVGQFTMVEKTVTVIMRWVQEYLEATTRGWTHSTSLLPPSSKEYYSSSSPLPVKISFTLSTA